MKLTEKDVFYKGGSAALLVMSPFQLLCAREAVEEFQFDEYRYVFVLSPRTAKRNEQMIQMAIDWGIIYDQFDASAINEDDFYNNRGLFALNSMGKKYDRIFAGDYWSPQCRMLSKRYASENAIVSFVDDGTSSIYVISGNFCLDANSDLWTDILKWHHLKHGFYKRLQLFDTELQKYKIFRTDSMFSVYSDVRPTRFLTHQNTFKRLLCETTQIEGAGDVVYFIGSPSVNFCTMYGISVDYLNEILYGQLCEIRKRFSDERIIYIPHPRDTNEQVKEHCDELKIIYMPLAQTAENYILSRINSVHAVYGFGSSTLINLKRMFPLLHIVSIAIENPRLKHHNKRAAIIHNYFHHNGIEMVRVFVSDENNLIRPISFLRNIEELLKYLAGGVLKTIFNE